MRHFFMVLLLAGCAAVPPPAPVTRIVTITPSIPPALLTCAPSPAVPSQAVISQAVVARYIVNLWLAGQDCRAHVTAIRAVANK